MNSWEKQLMQHILNEKYLGENEEHPKMRTDEKKSFLEAVANYHRLGEMIYAKRGLKEVTKTVQTIVEKAEALTIQESEHWFDNVTVSRHMKQLKEAYKVFEKTSGEMSGLQQRLEAAYDDMGSILGRYYNVGNSLNEDDDQYTAGVDDEGPALEEDAYTAGVDDKGPALEENTKKKRLSRLNEGRRVTFKGRVTNDLYNLIKSDPDAMIFSDGKYYTVDPEELRHDLKSDLIYGTDEDGEEYEIQIRDIEFIEF
jgi:hypothetical protein